MKNRNEACGVESPKNAMSRDQKITLKEAMKTVAHKGPVDIASAQRACKKAFAVLRPYLSEEEINKLHIAWEHAHFVGEGRREWDSVCKKIKERLKL